MYSVWSQTGRWECSLESNSREDCQANERRNPTVPHRQFHYGPAPVTAIDVEKCKKFLATANIFNEELRRWTDSAFNPAQYTDHEDRVFLDLKLIIDNISHTRGTDVAITIH